MSTEIVSTPHRVPSGEGLANFWWKTGRMTVKAGGGETGHAFAQIESFDPRGTATPLHVHHARVLTTISPAGLEELFVELGVPVTDAEHPVEAVLPPMPEVVRRFAAYGCEILGPPPSLDDLS